MLKLPYQVPSGEKHKCTRCGTETVHPKSEEPKVEIVANRIALVGVEIPEGYELADAVMRCPTTTDYWIDDYGQLKEPDEKFSTWKSFRAVILKKKWTWPEWLIAKYIAMQSNEEWYAFAERPTLVTDCWYPDCPSCRLTGIVQMEFPVGMDWRQSLMRNPNKE